MNTGRVAGAVCAVMVTLVAASGAHPQEPFGDAAAMTQFQRSVDTYAFLHRQVQRHLGDAADRNAMAVGLRAARPSAADGDVFTPIIAAAFRNRIALAARTQGCTIAASDTRSAEVPRVGVLAIGTQPLPSCLLGVLPRLPEELEYRAASVALILIDTHANMVVDVLHGAFPTRP
jgi:hypothetical protein